MKKKIFIEGMHCASCAANIEKSLKKIPGVGAANVSLMTKKGIVESDKEISDDELSMAVKRAGYKAVKIENA